MTSNLSTEAMTNLLTAGHTVGRDMSGKLQFQSTSSTSELKSKFASAIERLGNFDVLPPRVALILSLPIHNAILTQHGHRAAVQNLHLTYHQDPYLVLDWNLSNGWRDRRYLNPVTHAILCRFQEPVYITTNDWHQARDILEIAFDEFSNKKIWPLFLACAAAFWSDILPGLFWSHCVGLEPFQPLERSAIARRISELPLIYRSSDTIFVPRHDQAAYLSAGYQTKQLFTVDRIVKILSDQRKQKGSRAQFVEVVVPKLTELLSEAAREGRIQVLLVGFVIDLVVNGGLMGELSIGSLIAYLTRTLKALATELLAANINSLDASGWEDLYKRVVTVCDQKQLSKVWATIGAFHNYLEWLGVPPLLHKFGGGGAALPPRAMVVWKHDATRAVEFLDSIKSDPNCAAAQAALSIFFIDDFMVRIDEIIGSRVGDFVPTVSGFTLMLYPRTRDGKIKSDGVRHPIDLRSPALKARLHAWLSLRRRQGAKEDDFLFGVPRVGNSRHLHAETYSLVETALKVGSGDPNATSHGARHREGSERVEAASMPDVHYVDVNPLDQISASAGQNVTQSLREAYVHLYEKPLFLFTAAQFRGNAGYNNIAIPTWIHDIEFGIEIDRENRWKQFAFILPTLPPATFSTVLDAVEDLSLGLSSDSVALRSHLPEKAVKAIARICASTLYSIGGHSINEVREFNSRDFHEHQYFLVSKHSWIRQTRQDKYLPLHEWLDRSSQSEKIATLARKAIKEWKSAVKNGFLNAGEATEIASLIQVIRESGTPTFRVLVKHSILESDLPKTLVRCGFHFHHEKVARRGQWKVRLFICAVDADSAGARDAALAMHGFHSLFSAAEAYFFLIDNKE